MAPDFASVTNRPASAAAALLDPLAKIITAPTVTIGGVRAVVGFSVLTPTEMGLYQINIRVPAGVAVPVVVSISGQKFNPTTIAVQLRCADGISLNLSPSEARPVRLLTSPDSLRASSIPPAAPASDPPVPHAAPECSTPQLRQASAEP